MWALESWGPATVALRAVALRAVALGLSLSCAQSTSPERGGEEPQRDDTSVPTQVIATLRTRDSQLTVSSSGGIVLYTLVDEQGATKSLTLEQLQAHDPNLYEVVKSAAARANDAKP
jgi:hypothetical protein